MAVILQRPLTPSAADFGPSAYGSILPALALLIPVEAKSTLDGKIAHTRLQAVEQSRPRVATPLLRPSHPLDALRTRFGAMTSARDESFHIFLSTYQDFLRAQDLGSQSNKRFSEAKSKSLSPDQKLALITEADALKTESESLKPFYKKTRDAVMENYQEVLREEEEILYQAVTTAIRLRDEGNERDSVEVLRWIAEVQNNIYGRLNETAVRSVRTFKGPDGVERENVTEISYAKIILKEDVYTKKDKEKDKAAFDGFKKFIAEIERRQKLFQIDAFFRRMDATQASPLGAVVLEPAEKTEDYAKQVTDQGFVSVYVPRWRTRIIVPLDLEKSLAESGRVVYVTPGSGGMMSQAVSSVNMTRQIYTKDGKPFATPFLMEFPFHGYAPTDDDIAVTANTISWILGHLRDLKATTGHKPHFLGRSSGALIALFLARFFPEDVASVFATVPAAPTQTWIDYIVHFMNTSTEADIQPNAYGNAWFNGGQVATQLNAVKDRTDLNWDKILSIPGIRKDLNFHEPLPEDADLTEFPPTVVSWSKDDREYSDDAELFEGKVYPDRPLSEVWVETAKRFPHVREVGLPGGHLQFNTEFPGILSLARRLYHSFTTQTPDAKLERDLQIADRLRDMKLKLWNEGFREEALLTEGRRRLEISNDVETLAAWGHKDWQTYLRGDARML